MSALRTLKGKLGFRIRKCLFSDTSTSAPTHSAYAAISASASLNTFASYLAPISKGTRKSSSMEAKRLMNFTKVWKSFGVRLGRTSSIMVRHIEMECVEAFSMKYCRSDSQLSFLKSPRANMYSLASRTKRKFFLPQFLSGLAQLLDYFLFGHPFKWGRFFGCAFAQLIPQFFSLFYVFAFHGVSPQHRLGSIITQFNYAQVFLSNKTGYDILCQRE